MASLRRLYLAQGCSSIYEYCLEHLHLTEHAAYARIQAARLSRRFPVVLERLGSSDVSLTAVMLLSPFLTQSNHIQLLDEARGRRKAEIEEIVARLNPRPDVRSLVRKLPERTSAEPALIAESVLASGSGPAGEAAASPSASQSRPASLVKPLAPERYKVQFTVSGETRAKLRAVQDLLRHSVCDGDIGVIFDRALDALMADLEKKKLALVARPRKAARPAKEGTRLIPAAGAARGVAARPRALRIRRCARPLPRAWRARVASRQAIRGRRRGERCERRAAMPGAQRARGRRVLRRRARAVNQGNARAWPPDGAAATFRRG